MKAAVLHKVGERLTIEEIPRPQTGVGEVLVKVRACGIDGTDLKLLDGFGYVPELPFIMGHEVSGEVVEVSADVSDFAPGDRIVVYNFVTCGACVYCRTFRDQLCFNMRGIVGVLDVPGGFAEYICLPASQLILLPEERLANENDVKLEIECFSTGAFWAIEKLRAGEFWLGDQRDDELGLLPDPLWATLFFGWPGQSWTPPSAKGIQFMVDHLPENMKWSMSCMAPEVYWAVIAHGIAIGGHVQGGHGGLPLCGKGRLRQEQCRAGRAGGAHRERGGP